ncbi:MAG: GDSL-type esterase/lipase family protein [Endomicrobia bacterium]|nr:GDSL-type esterase/lipase family protein [Endomicrobiia bacterium]MCL2800057.1 GDSL-type esterase/lipase family protein [Endomicrobiia bacterium]
MKKLIFLILLSILCGCSDVKPLNTDNNGANIVAFGNSLTAGYGVDSAYSFPSVLQDMTGRTVINLGVSGDTARMGADRKEDISSHNPFMVLIEFGGNDAMKMRPLDETKAALKEIVDYVQSLGAIAVIVDTGGNIKMSAYTKMMKQIAKEKQAVFVPAIMDGIFFKPQLKSDGIHPNAEGYKLIAEKIYKIIKPYLE